VQPIVAQLPRIVTLNNMAITPAKGGTVYGRDGKKTFISTVKLPSAGMLSQWATMSAIRQSLAFDHEVQPAFKAAWPETIGS
jgi:hypothetical protein